MLLLSVTKDSESMHVYMNLWIARISGSIALSATLPFLSNFARFVNIEHEILSEIRTKRITVNFAEND